MPTKADVAISHVAGVTSDNAIAAKDFLNDVKKKTDPFAGLVARRI